MLRKLAQVTLAAAGYETLTAANGEEALALCESHPGIAMLVTDVMMPGMQGPELISRALQTQPALKVLCTSGYGAHEIDGLRALPQSLPFLEKPYLPSALVRAIAAELAPTS